MTTTDTAWYAYDVLGKRYRLNHKPTTDECDIEYFREVYPAWLPFYGQVAVLSSLRTTPVEIDWYRDDSFVASRWKMIERYAFAIPNEEALSTIMSYGPTVEIGAGRGYWAYELRRRGHDIVAYDTAPPDQAANAWLKGSWGVWTEVLKGDHRYLTKHKDRALFLCWPPYDDPMAVNCLRYYRGDTFIFVGENYGGCTGNDEFFRLLERCWTQVATVDIPIWDGLHDYMQVFKR